ncbi:hypothetical protein P4H71_09020 [Paenibacillus kribbensis]|uniref:XkdQ/YqbQ family protein n=1 Tax=Paenibacillus kribbensis TaxID=172713 RepID=UPI002DBAAD0E|nr:hypothetical protein [Paenibacillus kribbensis]MEC0234466.1 hypothetical protein [Paenibacillus kribbensis]
MEILLDNKNGRVWDVSQITADATWASKRIGTASSFEFTLIKGGIYQDPSFAINNGDVIRVKDGEWNIFYGYVFEISESRDESVKVKCYDQIRYLMSNDTYVFKGIKASDVVRRIADDFKLKTGTIQDTGYVIPVMIEDNKKLLDIVWKALDLTLIHAGQNFIFYDDFGKLMVRRLSELKVSTAIGDGSLMTDYEYSRSIDSDTYTKIKIVQNNKKSGKRDVYIAQNSANAARWGQLQLYQVADEKQNAAQINQLLSQLAQLKNRETRSLSLTALGAPGIRAGSYIPVVIEGLALSQYFCVDECSHSFEGAVHTMKLKLVVI